MNVRAMWKGIVRFGRTRVPVKLYAAVQDRSVHFRLLHAKDHVPVKQVMVATGSDDVVPYDRARRAFVTEAKDLVILDDDDLDAIEPEPSRDIEIVQWLPPEEIDHRFYLRPYLLGPDQGAAKDYAALVALLERTGREGLARWVMRKKDYAGALRSHDGHLLLMSLRWADEVVSSGDLDPPEGPPLADKELDMARQLIDMLADDFDPRAYRDEYRDRVEELIETKRGGGEVDVERPSRPEPTDDLTDALEASLRKESGRA